MTELFVRKSRISPLLILAFGALILLILLSGVVVRQNTREIYGTMQRNLEAYRGSDRALNTLRSQVYEFAILVRDYLLDPSQSATGDEKKRLIELHESMEQQLGTVEQALPPNSVEALHNLRAALTEYRESVEPIFEWTTEEKRANGAAFLRRKRVPYRESMLSMTHEIERLMRADFQKQQEASLEARRAFEHTLNVILTISIALGVMIAAAGSARMINLERHSERLWRQIEQDKEELRHLSLRVVKAQEEERKSISRELHDQIGQMLTALRLELGNLEAFRAEPGIQFEEHLRDSKSLTEETLRAVRDIAMGLRPSMLDDLGLAPAVEWQAREFTRRTGVSVDVQVEGNVRHLTEAPRTCIYRAVQEALTNCARHAHAGNIRITLQGNADMVSATVQDDGQGFTAGAVSGSGLGLLGIEERVKELGGKVSIFSQPEKGTLLRVEIPFAKEVCA